MEKNIGNPNGAIGVIIEIDNIAVVIYVLKTINFVSD